MKKDIIFKYLKEKLETEILEIENFKKLLEMQFPKGAKLTKTEESFATKADSASLELAKALENLYSVYYSVTSINQDINLLN